MNDTLINAAWIIDGGGGGRDVYKCTCPPKKHSINHTCSAGFRHGAQRRPMAREQQTHNMYCCCVFCCEQWDPFCYLSDAKLSAADRYPCPAAHEYSRIITIPCSLHTVYVDVILPGRIVGRRVKCAAHIL